ncbi:MAG TPA: thioredoxin [Candidatus Dormibacteraeota bacterium]|nr:thioredoxin [Candidatus Dormibacteraeota bacterium]
MKPTIELNETNFDREVLQAPHPVVVDFWAPWCGPCKMLAPVLDELAREHEGRATVGKVNIEDHPELGARFRIEGIPTLLYFRGGTLRDRTVGVVSKKTIASKLAALQAQTPESSAA